MEDGMEHDMHDDGDQITATQSSFLMTAKLKLVGESLEVIREFTDPLNLKILPNSCQNACVVELEDDDSALISSVKVAEMNQVFQCGSKSIQLRNPQGSALLTFNSHNDMSTLLNLLHQILSPGTKRPKKQSVFSLRTEDSSATQYFQFYGFLSQQQNMMQDYVRTSTYQSAMLQNMADFTGKVVIDVGAGSGILSFFAIQAGAKKVYAVEASSMAVHCQKLVHANNLSKKVTVIAGKIEEVDIPEDVDMIISEPMGYMLFNERMLESYVHARKWLQPKGKMFPTSGTLYCAPFTDELLHLEQCNKAAFWNQQHFHGIDVSALKDAGLEEYFRQPVVDTFDIRILVAKPASHVVDFLTATEVSLHTIEIPCSFKLSSNGNVHGFAFWFDILFDGSQQPVWLSTAPSEQLTHWYQLRCLFRKPILCYVGQELVGTVRMIANERQSYDVEIDVELVGTGVNSHYKYDLKNPYFRYTSPQQVPPGNHHTSPTEAYLATLQQSNTAPIQSTIQSSQIPLVNGVVPSNNPYIQYQNNISGYSTTSVYGHPLMTPGTTTGIQIGNVGGASQLWFPGGQSNSYDNSAQLYFHYKPSASPRESGYSNQMIASHS